MQQRSYLNYWLLLVEVLPVCSLPEISGLVREPSSQQALLLAVSSYV